MFQNAGRQGFIGGPWISPFMVPGHQHRSFLGSGPFASERVLLFKFCLWPSSLNPLSGRGGGHETLVQGAAGDQS